MPVVPCKEEEGCSHNPLEKQLGLGMVELHCRLQLSCSVANYRGYPQWQLQLQALPDGRHNVPLRGLTRELLALQDCDYAATLQTNMSGAGPHSA